MSAWMYSMMCPMWNGPLAYGSAVVTKILRGIPLVYQPESFRSSNFALLMAFL
jgi:hypothetical protein